MAEQDQTEEQKLASAATAGPLRGENADDPPAEPSVEDPDAKAESGSASGGG